MGLPINFNVQLLKDGITRRAMWLLLRVLCALRVELFTTEHTEDTERRWFAGRVTEKLRRSPGAESGFTTESKKRTEMETSTNQLTERIIGAAIAVHRELGPGLLESAYEAALAYELAREGIAFERQIVLPIPYKGRLIEAGYRLDMLVGDSVILELKAVERVERIHEAQLLTYLRLSGKKVGLLINFNVQLLKDGITRRVM